MALNDEQNARLTLVLEGLSGCIGDLYENAQSFVNDQIERHEKYGSGILISPKQWAWLERLYVEFVGEPVEQQPVDEKIKKSLKDDMDDEIPF